MRTIAMVDDNTWDCKQILTILEDYQERKGYTYDIHTFPSGKELTRVLEDNPVFRPCLYLLDIEMPEMNGIETSRLIRKMDSAAYLIFITSHMNYAPETMEYKPFRYINKEELSDKLPQAMDSFELDMEWEEGNYLVSFSQTYS